jgi:hypothetical protein
MSLALVKGSRRHKGSINAFPLTRDQTVKVFNQVADEVKTIGYLNSLRESLSDGGGKLFGAIPCHHLDGWVLLEPAGDRLLRAICQQGNRLAPFEIHDNGSIALTTLPSPLVQADDLRRRDGGERKGMYETQDRSCRHLHSLECCTPFC